MSNVVNLNRPRIDDASPLTEDDVVATLTEPMPLMPPDVEPEPKVAPPDRVAQAWFWCATIVGLAGLALLIVQALRAWGAIP